MEFIELLDDENVGGLARARCSTTQDIRQMVACGGFAAEFFLLRNGYLPKIDEKEITQIIFRNATKDREMFCGRTPRDNEQFTKKEDEDFMHLAINNVAPIFGQYFDQMDQIVCELIKVRKVDGNRTKELLLPSAV